MFRSRTLLLMMVLGLAGGSIGAKPLRETPPGFDDVEPPSLPDEKSAPFGEPVNGLACRIVAPAAVCHGQAIPVTIQLKNVSDHVLYVFNVMDPQFKKWASLTLTDPDGKRMRQTAEATSGFGVSSFSPLAAGETRRFDIPSLRMLYRDDPNQEAVHEDGKYTLSYRFNSPRLPDRSVIGERSVPKDGKDVREKIYQEATPEQQKFAWAGGVSASAVSFDVTALKEEDLVVHEWGVFTVFNDVKYANVNRQAEWSELPEFFYRQFPTQRLKWMPASWDKPIVYFYTRRPNLNVDLKVRFADGGAPVVWWPCASEPVNSGAGYGGQRAAAVPRFDSLHFDLWLGDLLPCAEDLAGRATTPWAKPRLFPLPANSWVTAARIPGASLVTTGGTSPEGGKPWSAARTETEKFVFYDGLMPAPDYLHCPDAAETSITLTNAASFDMPSVYVIDRRTGAVAGARVAMSAGRERKIDLAALDVWALEKSLREDLLHAGLFEPEADALLKIWHKGFFENAGVVAFYVLPRAEYERMLPMQLKPAPVKSPVRVGLAFHPNLQAEPAMDQRLAGLVKQLDDDDYHKREEARRGILEIGLAAMHPLRKARAASSANTQTLIDGLLQDIGAAQWLKGPPPAAGTQTGEPPAVPRD